MQGIYLQEDMKNQIHFFFGKKKEECNEHFNKDLRGRRLLSVFNKAEFDP